MSNDPMRDAMSVLANTLAEAFPQIHAVVITALFEKSGACHLWIHQDAEVADGSDLRVAVLKSVREGIERQIASYEAGLGEISADQGQS
jgi:hypothetical protein